MISMWYFSEYLRDSIITRDLPLDLLEALTEDAVLADVPRLGNEILKGRVRGRVVVDVRG